jgi:hypothetical protein
MKAPAVPLGRDLYRSARFALVVWAITLPALAIAGGFVVSWLLGTP